MDEVKKWNQSKTIWFNIGTLLVTVGAELIILAEFVPAEYRVVFLGGLAMASAFGNIILRTVTTKGIE